MKDCQIHDKRREKCQTATIVTSLSRRHMACHFVSGWCVMRQAARKERPIMYMIAMVLSAERILMFLFVSRCISGCHLYLRSDHFKAADCTLETYTQRRIRIFSAARFQIFRCNRRKQFLNTCRFLLSSFLLLFFWGRLLSCLCFLIKKRKEIL